MTANPDPAVRPVSVHGQPVYGRDVDNVTRCGHWHGDTDVIAIRFYCCGHWFPCITCHEEYAGHPAGVWPVAQYSQRAILCGVCGHQLTIAEYLASGSSCTSCQAAFNPGCANHYHLYFAQD